MSQSFIISNSIVPKIDKEMGMVLSYHYHLTPEFQNFLTLNS